MGFHEEIVKPKRVVTPYLLFSRALNIGNWDGPDVRLYSSKHDSSGPKGAQATVESFGTFSRSVANSLYTLEIPSITTRLLDPHNGLDWHRYANEPYDTILRKWIHYLLRVYDDNGNPFDATVALGQIIDLRYPPGRKASITASIAAPELLGERIPRRTITLDDWPNAPTESIGLPVPILYGRLSNAVELVAASEGSDIYNDGLCLLWTPRQFTVDPPSNPEAPGVRWFDDLSQLQGPAGPEQVTYDSGDLIDPVGSAGTAEHFEFGLPGMNYVDGWLLNNYYGIMGLTIIPDMGPVPGTPAIVSLYATNIGPCLTRGVGVQVRGGQYYRETYRRDLIGAFSDPDLGGSRGMYGSIAEEHELMPEGVEPWDIWPPRFGRNAGQYGASSMLHYFDPDHVLTYAEESGGFIYPHYAAALMAVDTKVSLIQEHEVFDASGDPLVRDPEEALSLHVHVAGSVGRRNGAYDWEKTFYNAELYPSLVGRDQAYGTGKFQTVAMKNVIVPRTWQRIEMKWKLSSFVEQTGEIGDIADPAITTSNSDGWLIVRVDGQVVLHLQEIQFFYTGAWPTDPSPASPTGDYPFLQDSWRYWESVTWGCNGRMTDLMVSDRLWCDEARPSVVTEADPCDDNISEPGSGAIRCPLVNSSSNVINSIQRVGGLAPAIEDAAISPPQNVSWYLLDSGPIGSGRGMLTGHTYYVVTALLEVDGVLYESAPSSVQDVYLDDESEWTGEIIWDASLTPGVSGYRVYQMTSPDLQLREDRGGVLRQETYWVSQRNNVPNNNVLPVDDPREFKQTYSVLGTGSPLVLAEDVRIEENTADYLVCGHDVDHSDIEVFAPLPGLREVLGGLNLMTGEKEPITFEETEARMTRLVEGVDYEILSVEKPSGRFTVVHVTRNMRSLNNCSYAPLTVNLTGIRSNADGTGYLVEDGAELTRHFLLNWVFNHYTTGEWFTDVEHAPGLIDSPSFDVASAAIVSATGFNYVGAVALITPTDARSLIQEALTTFGLNFFYKSALLQDRGAWSVSFIDLRRADPAWASAPLFEQTEDIVDGTFETALTSDLLRNIINYKAGPNLGNSRTQEGWLITGTLEDLNSITRFGRIEGDLQLPWTRDQATAVDRAVMELAIRRFPIVVGGFQTKGRGVILDPATVIRVGHEDAPGLGWEDRACLTIGNDLALDTGLVGIRFISPVSMIE